MAEAADQAKNLEKNQINLIGGSTLIRFLKKKLAEDFLWHANLFFYQPSDLGGYWRGQSLHNASWWS
jgi:hypothetical protein